MTRFSLVPHPDHPPPAVTGLHVELAREGETMALAYRVEGSASLAIPAPAAPVRTDGLWRTTCFELFVKPAGGEGYHEFNFSPSGQWAAYAFDGHRAGMRDLAMEAPVVAWGDGVLSARIILPRGRRGSASGLSQPDPDVRRGGNESGEDARIALTAVIEEKDGTKSFWSLAHPPGAPDFHHDACFVATLPAPARG